MSTKDLNRFNERDGMAQAKAAAKAERRKPSERDAPRQSTFPPTKATQAALKPSADQLRLVP